MNDLWLDLEHADAHLFAKEDFLYLLYTVQESLSKRHGLIEPEFAFYRKEEIVTEKNGNMRTIYIPRLTVSYIRKETATFMGLAYCSNKDNPNKFYGKSLALKRAILALVNREDVDTLYIREDTDMALFLKSLGALVITKSQYCLTNDYRLVPRQEKETN